MPEQRTDPTAPAKPGSDTAAAPGLVARVTRIVERVQAWFPMRVWLRFSTRNGQTLAAGASYQALFAIFSAFYVAFAVLGLWLGANDDAIAGLIKVINGYLPGAISVNGAAGGIISADQVAEVAHSSAATLSITGIVALIAVFWTAVGWIGSVRTTIRDIFGLEPEAGNPVLLLTRDLVAAIGFALLLLLGAVLGWAGSAALEFLYSLVNLPTDSFWAAFLGHTVAVVVMFVVDAVTLLLLFRFLTGTALGSRDVLTGALLGAAGMTVLQLAFGYLVGKAPSNPLLVTFAVLIGLLLWIRLVMMVILLAASWVAESAEAHHVVLEHVDENEQRRRDAQLLVEAAELEASRAKKAMQAASVWRRPSARREARRAVEHLAQRRAERDALNQDAPTS